MEVMRIAAAIILMVAVLGVAHIIPPTDEATTIAVTFGSFYAAAEISVVVLRRMRKRRPKAPET